MTIDTEDLLNSIMASLDRIAFVRSGDIPNIDLYMDQVTTFMDRNLANTTRFKNEDKVLTKTMINNYAKNDLLPPPIKKKYSKEHVLVLILIYYFKNVLSISDIQRILNPLTEKYFGSDKDLSIKEIYDEVADLGDDYIDRLKEDVRAKYTESTKCFKDVKGEDKEFLEVFSFICLLVFDIYTKKLIIEKMLDDYANRKSKAEETRSGKTSKSDKKKAEK